MATRKGLGQANILRTNNNTSTGYGIVYADEVSGHRTVANLTALYALNDWQLSASGDNTNSDAIGQLWYVVDADGKGNGALYQLKDWSKRKEAAGWSIADYTTKAELGGAVENINTELDKKEDTTSVDQKLSLKADLEEFNNTVSGINTNIATKANAQDVTNAIGELQDKIGDRVVVSGNVTNNPDEEDITTEGDTPQTQVLKLKDRAYDSLNASGKGYKILRKNWQPINRERKNVLTQEMINEPNTIYEIRYDFDLNGAEIEIKEGCVLSFVGGRFSNGILNGSDTRLTYDRYRFLQNINIKGTFVVHTITSSFFDNKRDNIFNNLIALTNEKIENIIQINDECTIIASNTIKNILTSNTKLYINANIDINDNSQGNAEGISIGSADNKAFNIYINGGGYKLKGNIDHTSNPVGEWSHGIAVSNAENVTIENIVIAECWGDGIAISNSKNVTIDNVTCDSNRRQGFSIISGDNILLTNSKGINTGKIAVALPGAGLDIEPNQGDVLNQVHVRNCAFFNNYTPQERTTIPTDIQIYNNMYDVVDNIIVENCRCDGLWIGKTYNVNIKSCTIRNGMFVIDNEIKNAALYDTYIPNVNSILRVKGLFNCVNSHIAPYFNNIKNTYISSKPYIKITLKNAKGRCINIKWDICGGYPNTTLVSYATSINDNTCKNRLIDIFEPVNRNTSHRLNLLTKPQIIDKDIYFYVYPNSTSSYERTAISYDLINIPGVYSAKVFSEENILFEELSEKPVGEEIVPLCNTLDIGDAIHTVVSEDLLNTGSYLYDHSLKKAIYWDADDKVWKDSMGNKAKVNSYGIFANRPTDSINVGFPFFCTDKIAMNNNIYGLVIYYKGNNTWVDALGRVIDDNYPIRTNGPTSQRPTLVSTDEGFEYYDTSLKKKILWNGTEWTNMDGTSLGE